MYSPDQADIDPRNPANQPETVATQYYIDPNQFSDDDSELLASAEGIDMLFRDGSHASDAAFTAARIINKPVQISVGSDEWGDIEWFDAITVKPEVKVA